MKIKNWTERLHKRYIDVIFYLFMKNLIPNLAKQSIQSSTVLTTQPASEKAAGRERAPAPSRRLNTNINAIWDGNVHWSSWRSRQDGIFVSRLL